MKKLKEGGSAPDFSLVDQNKKKVSLSDFQGFKLLLYFYPKADTPGCTIQACSVRDAQQELDKLGVKSLGISPDKADKQKKFEKNHKLNFPLLADSEHRIAEAFGVWQEKSMFGKKYKGITRSSFLIDEQGKIMASWYKVSPQDTVPNVVKFLR